MGSSALGLRSTSSGFLRWACDACGNEALLFASEKSSELVSFFAMAGGRTGAKCSWRDSLFHAPTAVAP